jgi:6-phosphogluconolactonase (cycloisomerase 2 family)
VLRIKPDGSLDQVGGGPVDSNGVDPVSIAVHGDLVYVACAGTTTTAGETDYTGFTLNPGGRLRPLAGSTVTLPDESQPGDILFSSAGTKLVGTRVATSLIDSFTVGANGLPTAASGSPFAAQGFGPFGRATSPEDARLDPEGSTLWVVDPGADAISGFTVDGGSLTELLASPTSGPAGATPTGIVVT